MNHRARTISSPAPRHGFTMVEAVISILIVSVMLAAALSTVGAAARIRLVQKEQCQGAPLARQLLNEIMQCRYEDPTVTPLFGPEAGELRATFNDVDDFNNITETPPTASDLTPVAGYTGWTRAVKVDWVTPANPNAISATESGLKRITVTVTSPTQRITKLLGLRSKSSIYENVPATVTTYTNLVNISLQVGTLSTAKATSAVNPINQAP